MPTLNKVTYNPDIIIKIVGLEYHVEREQILNPKLTRHAVTSARYVAMYFIRLKNPGLTEAYIEALFRSGYRSFRHACRSVEDMISVDKVFKMRFELSLIMINRVKRCLPLGRPKKC